MYKLNEFEASNNEPITRFIYLFKSKWDELHDVSNVFRYKVDTFQEKLIGDFMLLLDCLVSLCLAHGYLSKLNIDRNIKRRLPEQIENICQPFDSSKFNFTKVSSKEILFSIGSSGSDVHSVLVNVSPISRYHSLLCPSIDKCLPQIATADSLLLVVQLMFTAQDWGLRIVFNSLCGLASVNHLHYHLVMSDNDFAVEKVKWVPINNHVYHLDKRYPISAFCFQIRKLSIFKDVSDVFKLVEYFLKKSIAHNILMTPRVDGVTEETVGVIVWPRKSTKGAKLLSAFNVAALELSGWFPVYDTDSFENLSSNDLERELRRWRIDNFDELCEQIKQFY